MLEYPFQTSRLKNVIIAKNPRILAGGQIVAMQEIQVWTYIRVIADVPDRQALILKPAYNGRRLVLGCIVRDEQLDSCLSVKLWRKRRQKRRKVNRAIVGRHSDRKKRPAR